MVVGCKSYGTFVFRSVCRPCGSCLCHVCACFVFDTRFLQHTHTNQDLFISGSLLCWLGPKSCSSRLAKVYLIHGLNAIYYLGLLIDAASDPISAMSHGLVLVGHIRHEINKM